MLQALVAGAGVVLPPFNDLFNNVTNSPFFGPPPFFSLGFSNLLVTGLLFIVFDVADSILSIHESINMQQPKMPGFHMQVCFGVDIIQLNFDFLPDRKDAAVDEDVSLCEVVSDLSVCDRERCTFEGDIVIHLDMGQQFSQDNGVVMV
jgi:hypothetical protein